MPPAFSLVHVVRFRDSGVRGAEILVTEKL
jgi:hypothetical protein